MVQRIFSPILIKPRSLHYVTYYPIQLCSIDIHSFKSKCLRGIPIETLHNCEFPYMYTNKGEYIGKESELFLNTTEHDGKYIVVKLPRWVKENDMLLSPVYGLR